MSHDALTPAEGLAVHEPHAQFLRHLPIQDALIDSGPLLALFNRSDKWHVPTLAWLQAHPQVRLHSTWPVLTEVCALLARRIHNDAALMNAILTRLVHGYGPQAASAGATPLVALAQKVRE